MTTDPPDPGAPEDDVAALHRGEEPEGRTFAMELVWRCLRCGYLRPRTQDPPDACPDCGAPRQEFVAVTED